MFNIPRASFQPLAQKWIQFSNTLPGAGREGGVLLPNPPTTTTTSISGTAEHAAESEMLFLGKQDRIILQ